MMLKARHIVLLLAAAYLLPFVALSSPQSTPNTQDHLRAVDRLIAKADEARAQGDNERAARLYGATVAACAEFERVFPNQKPSLIRFRRTYCHNQLALLPAVVPRLPGMPVPQPVDVRMPSSDPSESIAECVRLCQTGKFKDAERLAERMVQLNKRDGIAHLLLGTAALGQGRTTEALTEIRLATVLNPDSQEAHYNLAQLLIREEPADTEAAKRHYMMAVELGAVRDEEIEVVLNVMVTSE